LTNIACGEKFFVWMVVLVLKSGLKNDTLGKNGEERRNCCVAGTGYNPARWKTMKLPIAPLSGSMIANELLGGRSGRIGKGKGYYRHFRATHSQMC